MPDHRQTQAAFAAALADPDAPPPAPIAWTGATAPVRRFNVYRNNVYAGLIGVLAARYPAVERLVGEEFFKAMARLYVDCEPPASPVMIEYGEGFATFVETFEPAADVPYLADVARLEWLMHRARHAGDREPVRSETLGAIDAERIGDLVLEMVPSFGLLASPYPVFTLWQANSRADAPVPSAPLSGAEAVLVTRVGLEAEALRLPEGGASFVAALAAGMPLAAAAEIALAEAPEFQIDKALAALIRQGAIARVAFAPPSNPDDPS